MSSERATKIESILTSSFTPSRILVKDQSHLHAGHAGAQDGRGHFAVTIVSEQFTGQSKIARHRMIFDALGDMLQTDIHARSIKALTADEA